MPTATSKPAYEPLYVQVRNRLVQRIGSGQWAPGDLIPNEFQLAREYNEARVRSARR
jgi:GntR family transcriptional regulator